MFVGHYSASFAAKRLKPSLPLWHLFVATQLIDFGWALLVLAGVEKVRIIPHFMEASSLDLHYMPYTHSLPGSLIWASIAGLVYALLWRGGHNIRAGLIFAAAVFSHWLLDLIVHAPDLLLYPGGAKVGFGLWHSLLWSQVVEVGLLVTGFIVYMVATKPRSTLGNIAPFLFLAFLLAIQAYSHLPIDVPPTPQGFAITALIGYSLLSFLAWLVDMTRANR